MRAWTPTHQPDPPDPPLAFHPSPNRPQNLSSPLPMCSRVCPRLGPPSRGQSVLPLGGQRLTPNFPQTPPLIRQPHLQLPQIKALYSGRSVFPACYPEGKHRNGGKTNPSAPSEEDNQRFLQEFGWEKSKNPWLQFELIKIGLLNFHLFRRETLLIKSCAKVSALSHVF